MNFFNYPSCLQAISLVWRSSIGWSRLGESAKWLIGCKCFESDPPEINGFGNRISESIIVDFASHDLINFWFTTWRMFSITINMLLYLLWEKIKFWIFLYPKSWVPDVRRYYYNKLSWKLRRSYLQNREVNVWQISVPYLQLFNQNSRLVMKIYKKALFLRS